MALIMTCYLGDTLIDILEWEGDYERYVTNNCEEMCVSWFNTATSTNCRLSLCFESTQCLSHGVFTLTTDYFVVENNCRGDQLTGGQFNYGRGGFFEVRNNPDYVGEPTSSTSSIESRALSVEKRGNVTVTTMSRADFEAMREEEDEAARHELAIEQGREPAPAAADKETRQDDLFYPLVEYIAVAKPGGRASSRRRSPTV